MSGFPVVIATNGLGVPVIDVTGEDPPRRKATPVTLAENGRGLPVVLVGANGLPVTFAPALEPEEPEGD